MVSMSGSWKSSVISASARLTTSRPISIGVLILSLKTSDKPQEIKVKLSIVVPCYNEEKNLLAILEAFKKVLTLGEMELIVVNNGSTDGSAEVLSQKMPEYPFAKLVHVPVNRGYGFGIVSGLRVAEGEIIGWTHADMQTDPADVVRGYQVLMESTSKEVLLKGKRVGRPFFDVFFTFGMSLLSSALLRYWLFDINAQPKLFNRTFLREMKDAPDDFSLDLYLLLRAKQKKISILEIPVLFAKRQFGEAKGGGSLKGKWKLMKRTFSYILKIRRSY
jgi:glycosyltransferase involved in cell wall biosynthesis